MENVERHGGLTNTRASRCPPATVTCVRGGGRVDRSRRNIRSSFSTGTVSHFGQSGTLVTRRSPRSITFHCVYRGARARIGRKLRAPVRLRKRSRYYASTNQGIRTYLVCSRAISRPWRDTSETRVVAYRAVSSTRGHRRRNEDEKYRTKTVRARAYKKENVRP